MSICHITKKDHHHEDTAAFKEHFIEDVKKVDNSLSETSFDVDSFSPINNTAIPFDEEIETSIKKYRKDRTKTVGRGFRRAFSVSKETYQ